MHTLGVELAFCDAGVPLLLVLLLLSVLDDKFCKVPAR